MSRLVTKFHEIWSRFMTRRKVLFNTPSYFHTYFLQKAMRQMGIKVDTYVPWEYPEMLLWYKSDEMIRPLFKNTNIFFRFVNNLRIMYLFITSECVFSLGTVIGGKAGFMINKIFGRKQMCNLSSCAMDARMSSWEKVGNGRLCDNCGLRLNNKNYCTDELSDKRLKARTKYSIGEISSGAIPFCEAPNEKAIPFICCDSEYFNQDLVIPDDLKIDKKPGYIYIIHSFANDQNRSNKKNLNPIKGTEFIFKALESLGAEGYKIELINPTDLHQSKLRFLQVQADFCVDELRYGWWGSTPLECAALGVPAIVYMDPIFMNHWKKNFPELKEAIPFISATPETVYSAIKLLCDDLILRKELSEKSLIFSKAFLDPNKNAKCLIDVIDGSN